MKNHKSLNFLFVAFLFGIILNNTANKIYSYEGNYFGMIFASHNGVVLGDDDEKKDEESHEENKESEQEKEQEEEKEREHEEEQRQEREDERVKEEKKVDTKEKIINQNGSATYIHRQSEGGKTEAELKTYDKTGKLIEERKIKQEKNDDGKSEVEVESFLAKDGALQELKVKSKEGKELEISVKSDGDGDSENTGASTLEYNANNQELKIKYREESRELSITTKEDYFEIGDGVEKAAVKLPLTIDQNSGEVFVETAVGLVRVGVSPDRAVEIVRENEAEFEIKNGSIELKEGGGGLEYEISLEKNERLIGLFPITVSKQYLIDAETGQQNSINQGILSSLLDLLSF